MGGLHSDLFDELESEGFFVDPVRREVESIYMMDVINRINVTAKSFDTAQKLTDDLLRSTKMKMRTFETAVFLQRKELAERIEEEQALRLKCLEEQSVSLKIEKARPIDEVEGDVDE